MSSRDFRLVTHWRVYATAEEVFRILEDPAKLPDWWPSVYLAVESVRPGGENAVGRTVALVTRGWLPYTLAWVLRVTEARRPFHLAIEAEGDLQGSGVWTLEPQGAWVAVTFEWEIEARKPILRALSPLFSPILAANHRWAMARGVESLNLELARRRAATPAQRDAVAPPPPPARHSGLLLAVAAAGLIAVSIAGGRRLRRERRGGWLSGFRFPRG